MTRLIFFLSSCVILLMCAFYPLGFAMFSAIIIHRGFFLLLIIIITQELVNIRPLILDLSEALHLFKLFERQVTKLVDADFVSSGNGVMRADHVEVLLEYREARIVLLLREVVTIVLRHKGLESLEVICGNSAFLEKASRVSLAGLLSTKERRQCCHRSN